jgi:hypothetical protein
MGTAANNERVKLRATYFNNISIGLYVAGFFIPYLSFAGGYFARRLHGPVEMASSDVVSFGVCGAAFILGYIFRKRADLEIQKIQD